MTIRRPMAPEEAENLAGSILDRAIERARVTNVEVALAIVALPRLARAIAAEMSASLEPDEHATPAIRATQEASLAGAELARVGFTATMDGVIDDAERVTLRAQSSRCRKALDVLDASLARSEVRVS